METLIIRHCFSDGLKFPYWSAF